MTKKEAIIEKRCSECMYYKNETYCIRKKEETEEGYCLHYVKRCDRHSNTKIIDQMANFFLGNGK